MIIANVKTDNIIKIIAEFSFTEIPKSNKMPVTISIHGKMIAKKLSNEIGSKR